MIKLTRTLFGLMLALAAALTGCGQTARAGGEGSETHWLSTCELDSDCELGACLCGACTVACSTVRDCPAPLDACTVLQGDGTSCEQTTCQSSGSGQSQQSLRQQPPPETEVFPTCDAGRAGKTLIMRVGATPYDPGYMATRHVVADRESGFLLFGGGDEFFRIGSDGNFIRRLPPPSPRNPEISAVVPLSDGSLLLAGRAGGSDDVHSWVAKLDADWNLVWELDLELSNITGTDLATLPDGGAIVTGASSLDNDLGNTPDDVFWARISPDGQKLWERRASFVGPEVSRLAITGQEARIAVSAYDGISIITSDLEGNSEQALVKEGFGSSVDGLRAFSNGHFATLGRDAVRLLDPAGQLSWEHAFDYGVEQAHALTVDVSRDELLIAAGHWPDVSALVPATLLQALDSNGGKAWELLRQPSPSAEAAAHHGYAGVLPAEDGVVYGDALDDVAVDPQGNILANEATPGTSLRLLWVGNEACGD